MASFHGRNASPASVVENVGNAEVSETQNVGNAECRKRKTSATGSLHRGECPSGRMSVPGSLCHGESPSRGVVAHLASVGTSCIPVALRPHVSGGTPAWDRPSHSTMALPYSATPKPACTTPPTHAERVSVWIVLSSLSRVSPLPATSTTHIRGSHTHGDSPTSRTSRSSSSTDRRPCRSALPSTR
jgi:hypothetical protein